MLDSANVFPRLTSKRDSKSSRRFLTIVIPIGVIAAVPLLLILLSINFHPTKIPFENKYTVELQKTKPQFVFIGNSMLGSRIDQVELEQLIGGAPITLITEGGGMSALWYLQFKNYVVASGVRPKTTFFFFRDARFTRPLLRTDGKYRALIERTMVDDEPEFYKVVNSVPRSMGDRLRSQIRSWVIIDSIAKSMTEFFSGVAFYIAWPGRQIDSGVVKRINQRFHYNNFRPSAQNELPPPLDLGTYDFKRNITNSFLPAILRLAEEQNMKLAFIRVQNRPTINGPRDEPLELVRYVKDMKEYIEAHEHFFYDFTGDPEITLSMYGQGDHINRQNIKRYTQIFHDRSSEVFQ